MNQKGTFFLEGYTTEDLKVLVVDRTEKYGGIIERLLNLFLAVETVLEDEMESD